MTQWSENRQKYEIGKPSIAKPIELRVTERVLFKLLRVRAPMYVLSATGC